MQRRVPGVEMTEVEVHMANYFRRQVAHRQYKFDHDVLSLATTTTTHCTVHISVAWRRGVAAWARATYQYHVNGMDMVSRSVDAPR